MNCPDCKAAMKPLFTGHYCPNNCDRPDLKAKVKAEAKAQPATAKNTGYGFFNMHPSGWSPFAGRLPSAAPPLPDDQCRDRMCNSKGTKTHAVHMAHSNGTVDVDIFYKCNLCSATWSVRTGSNATTNGTATPAAQGLDAFIPVWN